MSFERRRVPRADEGHEVREDRVRAVADDVLVGDDAQSVARHRGNDAREGRAEIGRAHV